MQIRLKVITLQGAIEESPILLSQYWKFEWLDGTIINSYFGGSNNIFAECGIKQAVFTLPPHLGQLSLKRAALSVEAR